MSGAPIHVVAVIPTIKGREDLLLATLESYRDSEEVTVTTVIVRECPTIGAAWRLGANAALALHQSGERGLVTHVQLSADDVLLAPLALRRAAEANDGGIYPSPRIENPDGSLHSCGSLGAGMLLPELTDGSPALTSGFPMVPVWLLPHLDALPDIHYYADDWVAYQARVQGLEPRVCRGYRIRHLEGITGRARMQERAMRDRATMLASLGGPLPPSPGDAGHLEGSSMPPVVDGPQIAGERE